MAFSCTICTDIFVSSDDIHVTPCGHAFHYVCILQWLERSKTCPECRNKCIAKSLIKIYLKITTVADNPGDNALLQQNFDNLKLTLREKEVKLKNLEDAQEAHKLERKKMKKLVASLENTIKSQDTLTVGLRFEIDQLRTENSLNKKLKEELKKLENQVRLMKTVGMVIDSSSKEIEGLLASNNDPQTLAVLAASLKRELQASEFKRNELRDRLKMYQNDLHKERAKCRALEDKLSTADSEMHKLQQDVKALSRRKADIDEDNSDASVVLNTPEQEAKRKRPIDDSDMNKSTPMAEKVRRIVESDSPYLPIKSAAFGLHPVLFRKGLSATALDKKSSAGTLTKTRSDLSDKFSIFAKPPSSGFFPTDSFGGLQKKENLPSSIVPIGTRRIVTIKRDPTQTAASSSNVSDGYLSIDLDS